MNNTATIDGFDGDFDLLPLRAQIVYGQIPEHPTYADFALAVTDAESNRQDPAAHWRVEAIRERRLNPGVLLDTAKAEINRRTGARMYAIILETM